MGPTKCASEPERPVSDPKFSLSDSESPVAAPKFCLSEPEGRVFGPTTYLSGPERTIFGPKSTPSEPERPIFGPTKYASDSERRFVGPEFRLSGSEREASGEQNGTVTCHRIPPPLEPAPQSRHAGFKSTIGTERALQNECFSPLRVAGATCRWRANASRIFKSRRPSSRSPPNGRFRALVSPIRSNPAPGPPLLPRRFSAHHGCPVALNKSQQPGHYLFTIGSPQTHGKSTGRAASLLSFLQRFRTAFSRCDSL